ncbi:hypothetical protein [Streptomyces sp. NPDC056308]|uniref:hypothetical protein n=1 Tax=Streptomyces sp. NPDC056308 TaxID=3345780 RepID=UPI0035DCF601
MPPTTSSLHQIDAHPLETAPPLLRTHAMSYWHRPRSGLKYPSGCITLALWCTGYVSGDYLSADEAPADEPVCGTCDGRAAGAGQIPGPDGRRLVFAPRDAQPLRNCPGSRTALYEEQTGGRVGRCRVCGAYDSIRAVGGPCNSRAAIVQHEPGPALIEPCPFHRWKYLVAVGQDVACACTPKAGR